MKKTFVLILIGIVCIQCTSIRITDLSINFLRGKVKSVQQDYYTFEIKDKEICNIKKKTKWKYSETQEIPCISKYNKHGFYTQLIYYFENNRIDTSNYYYDKRGFLKQVIGNDTTKVKCDENGNVIKTDISSSGFIINNRYDKRGNLIYSETIREKLITDIIKMEYENKKLVFKKEYSDGKLLYSVRFSYNEKEKSVIANYKEDQGITKYVYYLNEHKDIVKSIYTTKDGKENITKFVYQYDKHNNWIKRYVYDNKKPSLLTQRVIEYYQ